MCEAEFKKERTEYIWLVTELRNRLAHRDAEWEQRLANAVEVMAEGKDKDCQQKTGALLEEIESSHLPDYWRGSDEAEKAWQAIKAKTVQSWSA